MIRTSSITTAFPRITTIPMGTFACPTSSTASSRTMFRYTYNDVSMELAEIGRIGTHIIAAESSHNLPTAVKLDENPLLKILDASISKCAAT